MFRAFAKFLAASLCAFAVIANAAAQPAPSGGGSGGRPSISGPSVTPPLGRPAPVPTPYPNIGSGSSGSRDPKIVRPSNPPPAEEEEEEGED